MKPATSKHHETERAHERLEKARINFRMINHTVTRTIRNCHNAFFFFFFVVPPSPRPPLTNPP